MKKILTMSLMAAVVIVSSVASAGGKAYQFIFDQEMSQVACVAKADSVAAENQLSVQPKDANGDYGLNSSDGERAGIAYYTGGVCHIYIF